MGTATEVKKGQVLNYEYTGSVQSVTLPEGSYKLEVWGAQGGSYNSHYGGAGGYSVGTLTIPQDTDFYIYVGGQPATDTTIITGAAISGGYNGGGAGCNRTYSSTYTYGQGGGGGTDIRIREDSLYARVIVAGGGGGSASNGDERTTKYGGGLSGGCVTTTIQATQTYGGTAISGVNLGTFGQGGSATTNGTNYKYGSGGGGGGWYGGGASSQYTDSSSSYRQDNSGGSGYVYTADTEISYPSDCRLTYIYFLADAQTVAGNTSFPSPSGGTETGHEGNGYARITVLTVPSSINAPVKVDGHWHQANGLFVKVNSVWKECVEAWMKVDGVWKSLAESTFFDPSILDTLSLGDTLFFGKYQVESETPWPIEWEIVHQTDEYQIAQTKEIIDLRCFDAKEPKNLGSGRDTGGNNNWQYSNIKQFLNSASASWYSAQHNYDAPPNSDNVWKPTSTSAGANPYYTHKGFLYYFTTGEIELLKDITFDLYSYDTNSSYSWTGKVWLPTYTQLTGEQNSSITEGIQFSKYTNGGSKIKEIHENCVKYNPYWSSEGLGKQSYDYWTSSAISSMSFRPYKVSMSGDMTNGNAYIPDGLAPCICLPRSSSPESLIQL